jgi:hypothetical protein
MFIFCQGACLFHDIKEFPTSETYPPLLFALATYAGGDFCLLLLSESSHGRQFAPSTGRSQGSGPRKMSRRGRRPTPSGSPGSCKTSLARRHDKPESGHTSLAYREDKPGWLHTRSACHHGKPGWVQTSPACHYGKPGWGQASLRKVQGFPRSCQTNLRSPSGFPGNVHGFLRAGEVT